MITGVTKAEGRKRRICQGFFVPYSVLYLPNTGNRRLRTDMGTALFDEDKLFYKVPASVPSPQLEVELSHTGGAHVLRLHTEHFMFANMCKNPQAGESLVGHAHLFLDGRKIATSYDPVALLPKLAAGKYRLTVSLNLLPDHRTIIVAGEPVSADISFIVPESTKSNRIM